MISKRKKTATGIFAPKNRKFLLLGIGAAAVGTWLLAGDQIKALLMPQNEQTPPTPEPTPEPTPTPKPIGYGVQNEPQIDINKKLKKGVQGNEVARLQFIINSIAALRGTTSYKTPGGYTVNFPIKTDGDFGNNSQAGSYFIAPSFKNDGFITLETARNRFAYLSGYYNKPFPSELVGTKNYSRYQESYKNGTIDFGKDDRAGKIGGFLNP
jgi:hypothetical protein